MNEVRKNLKEAKECLNFLDVILHYNGYTKKGNHYIGKTKVADDYDEEINTISQALNQAETILHILGLHLKDKIRVQRFFQDYVLIINDYDVIINLSEDEYIAVKEWLEE